MNVKDRIEQAPACEVINLTEAEKDIYSGAGWKLALFDKGALVEFFDPADCNYLTSTDLIGDAVSWLRNIENKSWENSPNDAREVFLVMCSCYQLCEPRRITITDASDMAHVARVFGEVFANG